MTMTMAVTGGIGAGKSTVSAVLARLGAVVVDSDRLAREVVAPGTPGLARVVDKFGPEVMAADGSLDRAALAAIVFSDAAARRRLERITHPLVRAEFDARLAAAPADAVVVNDIPLLTEQRVAARFHLVLGVHAEPGPRLARLVARGLTASDAQARIAAQIDDDRRAALCDAWLPNNADEAELMESVEQVWRQRVLVMRDALLDGRAVAARQWTGLRPGVAERTALRFERAVGAPVEVRRADDVGLAIALPAPVDAERLTAAGFPPDPDNAGQPGSADPGLRLITELVSLSTKG